MDRDSYSSWISNVGADREVAMFHTNLGPQRLVAVLPVDGATLSTL